MKKFITFGLIALILMRCEDVYVPDIDARENVIVVDGRLVFGEDSNSIRLTKSNNFNEQQIDYSPITNATVTLIENNKTMHLLPGGGNGNYLVNFKLGKTSAYKLKIEYEGDIFESEYEPVPDVPQLDTVYGISEIKVTRTGGENSVDDFRETEGVQLYTDIENETVAGYYRFTSKKIVQYTYIVIISVMGFPVPHTMYAWNTYYPKDLFNIAGPPDFSATSNIQKHPLYFMEKNGFTPVLDGVFAGWILILDQHRISESAYNFYKDLNNQLDADGKLFDPLYVQARNNLRCVTDPSKIVLGNFEISAKKETRYFVRYINEREGYLIRPIYEFDDIPAEGTSLDFPPPFWE